MAQHIPTLSYVGFRQAIRKWRPSVFLPALARHAAHLDPIAGIGYGESKSRTPWAVSAMARESVLYSNEFRSNETPLETDFNWLYNLFNNTFDLREADSIAQIVTPLAHEQFTYQESPYEEMARAEALFGDSDASLGAPIGWEEIFGMPLHDASRATFVLSTWVARNGGEFDPALFDASQMQELFSVIAPRRQIEQMASRFVMTVEQARASNRAAATVPESQQRFAFNPFVPHPLINLGAHGIWAPQPMLMSQALYPSNLYYVGSSHWGNKFTRALGPRTQTYIGNQIKLIAGTHLLPEIEYATGQLTVDWIWITSKAVILVECKSARLTLGARAGDPSLSEIVARYVGKGRMQIDNTADVIKRGLSTLAHIPNDRPIVGIVVTSEPFYLANSTLPEYGQQGDTPSLSISIRELEQWVRLPPDKAIDFLLETLADNEKRTWAMSTALANEVRYRPRNPILEAAWKQFDFLSVDRESLQ